MTKGLRKKKHYAVKTCSIKAEIKDVDMSKRIVTGFFNTYNFIDSDGDILVPGCAAKSISDRGPNSQAVAKIKHALNHDLTQLPGKIVTLKEDKVNGLEGIYFETKMSDTSLGNDTLKNYLEGVYDNHSIGFRYMDIQFLERDAHGNSKMAQDWKAMEDALVNPAQLEGREYVCMVKEIMLYEGSTVAFGANQLTPYLGVKSGNKQAHELMMLDRLSKLHNSYNSALKNGTQTDDMLQAIEIQYLQVKQMISELYKKVSTKKLAPNKGGKKEPVVPVEEQKNLLNIATAFKLT